MESASEITNLAVRLEKVAEQVHSHMRDCSAMNVQTAATLQKIDGRIENIEKMPMKAVRWIGGIVIASTISVSVQNYLFHEDTARKTQEAADRATVAAQAATNAASVVSALKVPQG